MAADISRTWTDRRRPAEDEICPLQVKSLRTDKEISVYRQDSKSLTGSSCEEEEKKESCGRMGEGAVSMVIESSDDELGRLDIDLDRKSKRHNLTSCNVRAILHEVITHEHVVAMMKAAIRDTQDLPMFEPKMTRSRLKQAVLQGQPLKWSLSTNTTKPPQFVDIDLEENEDSSDEEYCPDDEEEEEEDIVKEQIPVLLRRRRTWRSTRRLQFSHLRTLTRTTLSAASFCLALWNCQSVVNKADSIPAFATQSALHLLALTETWITPENTATPAALSTRGGGLLINENWKFSPRAPLSNLPSLEYHAFRITAPITVQVIVIYRPAGQMGNFCGELDVMLSHFPEYGTPLIVMGDLNIHLDKLQVADVFALLNTFDLSLVSTPPNHKAGNNLDLILAWNCTTDILVTPLHLSDNFFIKLSLHP